MTGRSIAVQSTLGGVPYTEGFVTFRELTRHFALHGAEFNAADESEYESMADLFIGGPKPSDVLECTRTSAAVVRFSPTTQEFAVMTHDRFILTYFKARPCASVPPWEPKVNCHGERDNLAYFRKECEQ